MSDLMSASSVPSLVRLEEELTCSICLCVFESPVTTPCGHNFCLPCLEMTWGGLQRNFSCPQCRSSFDSRPELKKNTVLCRVVEEFQSTHGGPSKEAQKEKQWSSSSTTTTTTSTSAVACDSCLEAAAAKTCFTCMASFCLEHLRPHLESPAFRSHQLALPVRDLQQRTCQAHSKLLEFYCEEHASCICCFCLVTHKMCATIPMQEAKEGKESQLKQRLTELNALNEKALQALDQVRVQQKQISDTASRKLDLLKSEFLEMIALIEEEEKESVKKVLAEEKRVQDKYEFVYKVLVKKKSEIQGERDKIEMALSDVDDITFLKKKIRQLPFKDIFIPKIDLDQNLIHTIYQKAFGLKESVKQFLIQPQEKKTEGSAQVKSKPQIQSLQPGKKNAASNAPKGDDQLSNSSEEKAIEEVAAVAMAESKPRRRPAKRSQSPSQRGRSSSRTQSVALESFLTKSREELLEFATKFSLDFNTAHKKVILSERNTKISVSETPQNYHHHPQRFTYCSQVVAFQCYKRGIHYWEVELEHNNFCGIGVCYGSMARQGAESRLGRNSFSWCIEWFNARVSAWHNDIEKCLPNTKVRRIGVLLNYDGGFLIFFGISEKVTLLYKFRAQFTEALYPAFWVFSSGTTISLSQLK